MKKKLSVQEVEDLRSCLSIAVEKNPHRKEPNFTRAITQLGKRIWKFKGKRLVGVTFEYK